MPREGGSVRHGLSRPGLPALALLLAAAAVLSACVGAFAFTPAEVARDVWHAVFGAFGVGSPGAAQAPDPDALRRNVLLTLRLPRVCLAGLTGAVLGASGALMQGLFRNPIVEPGLTGTSAGAALGAAAVTVLGANAAAAHASAGGIPVGIAPGSAWGVAFGLTPAVAAAGAFAATWVVYRLAARGGRVDVFTLLLAGVAVNAVCGALVGLLAYVARDPQARSITFWNLGTFTTATWPAVLLVAAVAAVGLPLALRDAKALDALTLGEDEAALLGVDPGRLARRLLVVNTVLVAAATSVVGVVAFVGLVVPHLVRMLGRHANAFVLPAAALLGAALMEVVDVAARLVVMPAELPVGILTAVVGAPVFLILLLRERGGSWRDAGLG